MATRKQAPAKTVEGREQQMVAMAMDAAEKQLMDGTASSQVITHFLKLGTANAKLEREKMIHENKLLEAKTKQIENAERDAQLFDQVLSALQKYTGNGGDEYDIDDY